MGILALDDTDSSIDYSIGWNKAGSALEYNKTTSWTVVAGSTAKIAFRGTSIGVYGTIGPKTRQSIAPISAYSIDGGALSGFKAAQEPKAQYSQLFFQSPTLPDGAHVLTITNTVVADPLFLDFLLVSQAADTPPGGPGGLPPPGVPLPTGLNATVSVSSSSSASSSASSSSVVTTSAQTPTPAPFTVTITSIAASTTNSADAANASAGADLNNVASSKKSNAGAIVGGVLGAVCVLLVLAAGVVWWNRKRGRRNSIMSYRAAGSGSYWNRPLDAAATPHSDIQPSDPYIDPSPPPLPPPNMSQNQNYPPSVTSGTNSGYGQQQTRYPGGYTPGTDYYESSDLAYAAGPAQAQAQGGYVPPSQLMNQSLNAASYGNSNEYGGGYGGGNEYAYNAQGGYGSQGYNNAGYAPQPEQQRQPGERVRVRLD